MKPKTLILILFSLLPLHCAYYESPADFESDSGLPDSGGSTIPETADAPRHCQSHQDCPEDQRCLDGECLTEPPPCGENPAPDCAWGIEDPDECHQARGRYECSHLDPSWCWCNCPTGQEGCPCWRASHCRGDCMAEEEILSGEECRALKMGVCSRWTVNLGCWCVADFISPGFEFICSD
jgi:hypothetical protein